MIVYLFFRPKKKKKECSNPAGMWCKVLFFLTDEMVEAMKRVHRIIHSRMAFSVGHSGFLSLASPCLFEQGMQTFGNSRTNTRYNLTIKRNFQRQALK